MAAAPEVCRYFFTTGRGLSVLKRFRETFGAFKVLCLVKGRFAPSSHRRLRFESSYQSSNKRLSSLVSVLIPTEGLRQRSSLRESD